MVKEFFLPKHTPNGFTLRSLSQEGITFYAIVLIREDSAVEPKVKGYVVQ